MPSLGASSSWLRSRAPCSLAPSVRIMLTRRFALVTVCQDIIFAGSLVVLNMCTVSMRGNGSRNNGVGSPALDQVTQPYIEHGGVASSSRFFSYATQ
jgi:hypothetical protein